MMKILDNRNNISKNIQELKLQESTQETRYYEGDYRGFGSQDPERNWEQQKGRSLERFENRGPADVERGFQGDLKHFFL